MTAESEQSDTYTEPYMVEKIKEYIHKDKELCDIIYAASIQPHKIVIPFNPMKDPEIVEFFYNQAENMIPLVKAAIVESVKSYRDTKTLDFFKRLIQIEINEAPSIKMREWGTEHEGKPVAVTVMVVRQEKEETYIRSAEIWCQKGHHKKITGALFNPNCEDCEKSSKMTIKPSTVKSGEYRKILIQEPMEEVTNGDARTLDAIIKDDNVKKTFVGQRKRIIGVFRSVPQKFKDTNKIEIHVLSMQDQDDLKEFEPTEDDIKLFHELEKRPDYDDIIVESIAPQIKHEFLAKYCVLLSMIGAPRPELGIGLIHTLLVGDPSTGKSDILQYIGKIVKKFAFAVGGTMSGSGVTVSMDTLPGGDKVPHAGIIPQCDNGGVAIDEINQLEEEDIGKLFECMASGTIHYNKGGFDLNLSAYTFVVGGANPKYYLYNEKHDIEDNINLPAPFLSRFHFIVNMVRKRKSDSQKQDIYKHIDLIDKIGVTEYIKRNGLLLPEKLGAYITYCKSYNPVTTDAADKIAQDFQFKMEKLEQANGSLPIDTRFYHGIKRVSKSIARRHFKNTVEEKDVLQAIDLVKKTLLTFDMNVEAGQLQMKFQSDAKGKPSCFNAACHLLEQRNADGRFTEDECIKLCVEQYKEFFPTVERASVFFTSMAQSGKIDKIAGRYKLA